MDSRPGQNWAAWGKAGQWGLKGPVMCGSKVWHNVYTATTMVGYWDSITPEWWLPPSDLCLYQMIDAYAVGPFVVPFPDAPPAFLPCNPFSLFTLNEYSPLSHILLPPLPPSYRMLRMSTFAACSLFSFHFSVLPDALHQTLQLALLS